MLMTKKLLIFHVCNFFCPCCSFANRLTHIKENHKFQKDGKEGHRVEDPALGLGHIVSEIKDKHDLK